MLSPNIFNVIFVFPLINILVGFYKLFAFLNIPGALGWAILFLTFLIKVATYPFFKKQIESAKKIQEIRPKLEKLQKKYKNDPKKLQKAQIELYQEAGINPAVGCLLPLIQLPIFIALYRTFLIFLNLKKDGLEVFESFNKILYFKFLNLSSIDFSFLGLDLTLIPSKSGSIIYYLVPIITGLLQYYLSSFTNAQAQQDSSESEFQKAFQMQTKFLFPLFIVWISFSFPVGLSLYWSFFSLLSILQMQKIRA